MTRPIDLARTTANRARGVARADDPRLITTGIVTSIDVPGNRVLVSVDGSEPRKMPFLDGIYDIGRQVSVLRTPFEGGMSLLCLGPTKSATMRPTATVTAVDAGNNRATVALAGESIELPYIPLTTFSVDDEVYVLREPQLGGQATLIIGPCDVPPDDSDDEELPTVPSSGADTETAVATILPTSTGTYSSYRSDWDRWNTNRYGGPSTLYQGNPAFSSHGPFTGLATYGNQILDLGATTITKIEVRLRGAGLDLASYPAITVQGAPHASRPAGAPSPSGTTSSASTGKSGKTWLELHDDIRDALAAGTAKSLCTTGSGYNAVRGASAGDGMALRVTYTRPI